MFNHSSTFSTTLARILIRRLGSGPKRLIFLTTLIATAINLRKPDDRFVSSVDKALDLSKQKSSKAISSSLSLPVYVKMVIWRDRAVFQREFEILMDKQSSDNEIHWAAKNIVDKSPEWIRYNKPDSIVGDIVKYFRTHTLQMA